MRLIDQGWRQAFRVCGSRVRYALDKLASVTASPGSPGAETAFASAMVCLRELMWRADEICGPTPPLTNKATKEDLA